MWACFVPVNSKIAMELTRVIISVTLEREREAGMKYRSHPIMTSIYWAHVCVACTVSLNPHDNCTLRTVHSYMEFTEPDWTPTVCWHCVSILHVPSVHTAVQGVAPFGWAPCYGCTWVRTHKARSPYQYWDCSGPIPVLLHTSPRPLHALCFSLSDWAPSPFKALLTTSPASWMMSFLGWCKAR